MLTRAWVFLLVRSGSLALADQTRIATYETARDIVWNQLYPHGGTTLSCGEPFARRNDSLNVKHVYLPSWRTKFLGWGSRAQCRQTSPRFHHREADLPTLHPDLEVTNAARSALRFAILPGERATVRQPCDFAHDQQ